METITTIPYKLQFCHVKMVIYIFSSNTNLHFIKDLFSSCEIARVLHVGPLVEPLDSLLLGSPLRIDGLDYLLRDSDMQSVIVI
jgi:hypothetical protein